MSLKLLRKNGLLQQAGPMGTASIVLFLGAVVFGVSCSGTTPRPTERGAHSPVIPDAGSGVEVETDTSPEPDAPNEGDADPTGEISPSTSVPPEAGQPREDPVPWRWIEELLSEEEGDLATSPFDNTFRVEFADLDGDDQEELVVAWGIGQAMCRCERRAAVARRYASGYRETHRFSGDVDVVNLPGGLRGLVHYPNDDDETFYVLVLRQGRRRLTSFFHGSYGSRTETVCVSESGHEYNPRVLGTLVFTERDGERVLEGIREEAGCDDGPANTTIRRIEDLMRSAGVLPPE